MSFSHPRAPSHRDLSLLSLVGVGMVAAHGVSERITLATVVVALLVAAGYAIRAAATGAGSAQGLAHSIVYGIVGVWATLGILALGNNAPRLTIVLVIAGLVITPVTYRQCSTSSRSMRDLDLTPQTEEGQATAAREATDEQLRQLWAQSASALRQSHLPSSVQRYTEFRRIILDEAERRAPDEVARWLAENPATDELGSFRT